MLNTRYIAGLTENGELGQIQKAIKKSLSLGSHSFEAALLALAQTGLTTKREASANADCPRPALADEQ